MTDQFYIIEGIKVYLIKEKYLMSCSGCVFHGENEDTNEPHCYAINEENILKCSREKSIYLRFEGPKGIKKKILL